MKQVSEIDRLIELASDEAPRAAIKGDHRESSALSADDRKDPRPLPRQSPGSSTWRVLGQLRILLPHLARLLPLLERALLGTSFTSGASSVDTSRLDRGIAASEAAQRDFGEALVRQTAEIKLLRDQLALVSASLEQSRLRQAELASALDSLRRLVKRWALAIFVSLIGLLGLAAVVVLRRLFNPG